MLRPLTGIQKNVNPWVAFFGLIILTMEPDWDSRYEQH